MRESARAEVAGVSVRFERAPGDVVRADAPNIGAEGIFVACAMPLPIGKRLAFDVQIAGESAVINAVGRVEWARAITEGPGRPSGMGIRFIDMEQGSLDVIRRVVASAEPEPKFENGATAAEAFPPPARAHLPTLMGVAPAPPLTSPSHPSLRERQSGAGSAPSLGSPSTPDASAAPAIAETPRPSAPAATPTDPRLLATEPRGLKPVRAPLDSVPSSRASIAAISLEELDVARPKRVLRYVIGGVVGALALFAVTTQIVAHRHHDPVPAPIAAAPAVPAPAEVSAPVVTPAPAPSSVNANAKKGPAQPSVQPSVHRASTKHAPRAPAAKPHKR